MCFSAYISTHRTLKSFQSFLIGGEQTEFCIVTEALKKPIRLIFKVACLYFKMTTRRFRL